MKNTTIFKTSNYGKNLRFWHFCLLFFGLLTVTGGHAQATISVGSGTANSSFYLPVRAYYGYSYTQQIVTAAEYAGGGGIAGNITKIRYYISTAEVPLTTWNNWTIYIGHTNKTAFTSTTDWEPTTNLTQVFSGTVTQVSNSWMEITLTTPFVYNGTSNLVIGVDENAPLYTSGFNDTYFGSYTSTANSGIYYYNDDTNPNPATPPTATGRTATLPRLQFVGAVASCLAPTALVSSAISNNGATVAWTASSSNPASGYQYYQSTTNTAPTSSTTPTGNVAAGTSVTLSALTPNTPYYVWVRSNCGAGDTSSWSPAVTFTTLCDPQDLPYTQNFESVTAPALPECTIVQNAGTGNNWVTAANPGYGFTTKVLKYGYNLTNAANAWFYTKGLNLTAGTSYRLTYKYGNSGATTYIEKMNVAYGMGTVATAMTNPLADHANINNNVTPITNIVDFTPSTTGVYYIGFHAYSVANQDQLFLDDISVTVTPACIAPTALTVGTKTETSIGFSWTASTVAPAMGYEYYYSTSDTAPTGTTTASGNVGAGVVTASIASLSPSTTYNVWVRAKCDTNLYSDWTGPLAVTTLCDAPDITSTTPATICGQGTAQLQATASAGGLLTWYTAATGGSIAGTGTTLTTPVITETTSYYVEANSSPSYVVGPSYSGTTNNGANTGSHGIMITTTVPNVTINSLAVPFTGTGTMTIALKNTANSAVITSVVTGTLTGLGTTPLTIPVNLTIATPGSYLLIMNGVSGTVGNLGYTSGNTYPFTTADGSFSITNGYWYGSTTDNLYFYNLNVTQGCISPRQMVTATVTTAPAISATTTDAELCAGESTGLSVTSSNAGYTYSWMPGNLTGATHTVTPAQTTTYTVTATDTGSGCITTGTVTVTVNPLPVVAAMNDVTVCEGGIQMLTYEGAAGNVTSGTATGASVAQTTATTLGPNPFQNYYGGAKQQWIYTAAELTALGLASGSNINSIALNLATANSTPVLNGLTIKMKNTTVASFATTSSWVTGTVTVKASSNYTPVAGLNTFALDAPFVWDGTSNLVIEMSYSNNNSPSTGTNSATFSTTPFVSTLFYRADFTAPADMSAYTGVGTATFSQRNDVTFNFATPVETVWSPVTNLYTNAAATTPYTGGIAGTVYAKPTATATYTATASNAAGCSISDDVVVTVNVVAAPTADAAQTVCGGATVASLEATGTTVKWYAAATGGNALAANTTLVDGLTYYASQTVNNCESMARTAVTVDLTVTPAPTVADDTQTFCGAGTVSQIVATGTGLQWYTTASGGNPVAGTMALTPGLTVYYASQTIDGCESSARTAVAVVLNVTDAPQAAATQSFCNAGTVAGLMATGSGIQWFSDATGGTALASTTALTDGGVYYASQTANGCESTTRTMVTVSISTPDAPDAEASQTFCNSATVADLTATGEGIQWYSAETGGTALAGTTALTNGAMYYASRTVDGCESATRAMVTATVNMTAAPVAAATLQSFCNSATVADLDAEGTDVQWYTSATGGTALDADAALMDGMLYYASQTVNGCESVERATVAVSINAVADVTGDAQQTITVGDANDATIEDIVVNGNGNITWYPTEEDALAGTNAIEQGTTLESGSTYYAMQNVGNCTSENALAVTVDVLLGGEHFDAAAFQYYPNPVKDVLNISYSSDITSVSVFNMLGQQVISQKPAAAQAKVDMSSLADGAYIMKVTAGNAVKTIKVMKKQ